jgi:hypothetical protein
MKLVSSQKCRTSFISKLLSIHASLPTVQAMSYIRLVRSEVSNVPPICGCWTEAIPIVLQWQYTTSNSVRSQSRYRDSSAQSVLPRILFNGREFNFQVVTAALNVRTRDATLSTFDDKSVKNEDSANKNPALCIVRRASPGFEIVSRHSSSASRKRNTAHCIQGKVGIELPRFGAARSVVPGPSIFSPP